MDGAKYKRTQRGRKNNDKDLCPMGILDVIEVYYPDRYMAVLADRELIWCLFSKEEWIDILTRSRNSHKKRLDRSGSEEGPENKK